MYSTADGKKKFGSRFVGRKYDEMHAKDAEPTSEKDAKKRMGNVLEDRANDLAEESGANDSGRNDMAGEGDKDISQHPVVKEHGKATSVHIKHDHSANQHHVTSQHEDGHMNESDHDNAEDAHHEGMKLSGVETPEEEVGEPETDSMNTSGSESDGFDMPSL